MKYFRAMNLVTGGTGLVGSHLIYALLKRGEKVRATKRANSNITDTELAFSFYAKETAATFMAQIEWVDADLENPIDVDAVCAGITTIYHCAAQVSFRPQDAHRLRTINPLITANLVNAALANGVNYFAHVSSVAALGRVKDQSQKITEKTLWKDSDENSNYAISKYGAELEVWRGIEEGLTAGIVNPGIIVGPGNWNHSSNKFFKRFSKPFKYYSDGAGGFVDVRDVTQALLTLTDKQIHAERFILVGQNLPYRELFNALAKAYGHTPPQKASNTFILNFLWRTEYIRSLIFGTDPLVTKETARTATNNWKYDNTKAQEILGISFHDVINSVAEFVPYYRERFGN